MHNDDETNDYIQPEDQSTEEAVVQPEFKTVALKGMFENWWLDYASYVILERAVPEVLDGLKPVQRRLMHAMDELDDGRYNKVANIIGHTMKYHPHGDASIGGALVTLGQKNILVDTQGNWGNILTGDGAAAPRYIEARLSKFAREVVFSPKITEWRPSYDGRNEEPVVLPVKFPLLLAQGVEGIAVGLASSILPHNFNELIDGCIAILTDKPFDIYPDFQTGGLADVNRYNDGARGGKVRVRAKIKQEDKKTLVITEIPYGSTTISLIESILKANDKGKIKIRKIDDNTAANVEIVVHLAAGVSPDVTIDALYAFTDCEVSLSVYACVIHQKKPMFTDVKEILRINTWQTVEILRQELELRLRELEEDWHSSSLEKIFIEKEIYLDIRACTSFEDVIVTIDKGLDPYKPMFRREITREDIEKLTEIRIKRISAYNTFKADEHINQLDADMDEVKNHLAHLIDYAINFFHQIKKKYGHLFPRMTEIRNFDVIEAASVAVANAKLYINREEGFIGTGLKKDEYLCDCSDIDDIIIIRNDGTMMVTKVADKVFIGKNVIHADVFRRNDERTIYNLIYIDGATHVSYVKRFAVTSITRDKDYYLGSESKGTKVLYLSVNPNGEAERLRIALRPKPKLRRLIIDFDFATLEIKGRTAKGNILTRHAVRNVIKKEAGVSTLKARDIFYDDSVMRLNTDGRGRLLGSFESDDRIIIIHQTGHYRTIVPELTLHFEEDIILIDKFEPEQPLSVVYRQLDTGQYFIKRFVPELSEKKSAFLGDDPNNKLIAFSFDYLPRLIVHFDTAANKKEIPDEDIAVAEFIETKSIKAKGKKISSFVISKTEFIEPFPYENEDELTDEEDEALADDTPDPEINEDGTLTLKFD